MEAIEQDTEYNDGSVGIGDQYITFKIGEEEYAVDIMSVREIKAWSPTTVLPNSPEYVRGVINLRGTIVPVYDLRARFGMGETEVSSRHVMVIVAVGDRIIGMLVDAVSDIFYAQRDEVKDVPDMDRTVGAEYLNGLVTLDGRMVALLDIDRLFDIKALPGETGLA